MASRAESCLIQYTIIKEFLTCYACSYYSSMIKQNHVAIIVGQFGANRCHVHVTYINDMHLISLFSVSMAVCFLSRHNQHKINKFSTHVCMQEMENENRYKELVENQFCGYCLVLLCLNFITPQQTQLEPVTRELAVTTSVVCVSIVCISVCTCVCTCACECMCGYVFLRGGLELKVTSQEDGGGGGL